MRRRQICVCMSVRMCVCFFCCFFIRNLSLHSLVFSFSFHSLCLTRTYIHTYVLFFFPCFTHTADTHCQHWCLFPSFTFLLLFISSLSLQTDLQRFSLTLFAPHCQHSCLCVRGRSKVRGRPNVRGRPKRTREHVEEERSQASHLSEVGQARHCERRRGVSCTLC